MLTMSEIEFELSDDIIKERLRINDANTINGIYTICNNLYKEEIERTKAIEDKSKSLLSSIGVMLGLLFTVGGFLLYKTNFDVNINKTKVLFYAQILFIITLIGFSIMIVIIGAYVYYVYVNKGG